MQNNRILLRNDPGYISRLYLVGNPQLVRAWLEGDWSAVEGAYFPEFSTERHVIAPRELPDHWMRFRAMDWGSARPFSVGWYAVSDGTDVFPTGALIKYREWYGMMPDRPNVGLKMTAEEIAEGILDREQHESITGGVIDPAAFSEDGGPSIGERMWRKGVHFKRADNKRVANAGALGGWDQLRARLKGDEGKPALYFFSTCVHTIRTLPLLQHDASRAEDLDSDGEDHAADETRYACMSRPYIKNDPSLRPKPRFLHEATFDDLMWPTHGKGKEKRERI